MNFLEPVLKPSFLVILSSKFACAPDLCLYTLRCSASFLLKIPQKILVLRQALTFNKIKKFFFASAFLLLAPILAASSSLAAISFQVKNDDLPKTRIILYGFETNDPRIKEQVAKILDQIKENLASTALFEIVNDSHNPSAIRATPREVGLDGQQGKIPSQISIEKVPDFNQYKSEKIDAILIADIYFNETANKLEIKVRLWDMIDEKQLFGKFYSIELSKNKSLANLISDKVFELIADEKSGHFNTQIVYIAESGSMIKRTKRIAIMDFDGDNKRYLTNGSDLVLTPIFSKKNQELFFLRYSKNYNPQIYNMDLENKFVSKIGRVNKTTFAPAAHPTNPNLLLFSIIEDGNSNIYEINRYNDRLTKLTSNRSINTTPSYSPDGKRIVFSSDRSGTEKLYVMNYDGSDLIMISKGRGSYSKPVWSPDGRFIAFTNIVNNRFNIGIMTPEGKNERSLTSAYLVEGARWSPNGRYLIYSKKTSAYGAGSVPKLYVIDIVTEYERQLPTAANEGATDPDWGPVW